MILVAALTGLIHSEPARTAAGVDPDTSHASKSLLPKYPLKLSANHRYLVDQAGTPFLIVGDSP